MMIKEVRSLYYLEEYMENHDTLENLVFKNLDLRKMTRKLFNFEIVECLFIGCRIDKDLLEKLTLTNNYILSSMHLPFELFPRKLYEIQDLYDHFDPEIPNSYKNSRDFEIYTHFTDHQNKQKLSTFLQVTESIHDASIRIALFEYIRYRNLDKRIVGVMGGHKVSRKEEEFYKIAVISKTLTERGYVMTSGGGPGMMEATHLGAYFAGRKISELEDAISILEDAPFFSDEYWLVKSYEVKEKYPPLTKQMSVGVPTWVHGHEPPNPFPGKIAKFFAASIRQEVLIQIAKAGIIFSRGSAGTLREIYQTVEQNHYNLWDNKYPMVFFDKQYWTKKFTTYEKLKDASDKGLLQNLDLSITSDIDFVLERFK
jgi:predicted Rossmann-fold nucleotide-binding protein